jgi:hypothetical protein
MRSGTNQFVTAGTNKTAAIIVKLSEHLLDHGYTVWIDNFHNLLGSRRKEGRKGKKRERERLCWNFTC